MPITCQSHWQLSTSKYLPYRISPLSHLDSCNLLVQIQYATWIGRNRNLWCTTDYSGRKCFWTSCSSDQILDEISLYVTGAFWSKRPPVQTRASISGHGPNRLIKGQRPKINQKTTLIGLLYCLKKQYSISWSFYNIEQLFLYWKCNGCGTKNLFFASPCSW